MLECNSMSQVLHLRSELSRPFEGRSPLTPASTRALVDAGYVVNVERSPQRVFSDQDYEESGATLVPEGTWPHIPLSHTVIGLKELPKDTFPLKHSHIHFAHCFKNQDGWAEFLSRFAQGAGTLFDLEYLTDEGGERVAAFGYEAGFVGAALSILAWVAQIQKAKLSGISPYASKKSLLQDVRTKLATLRLAQSGQTPRIIILGALGRCGKGAAELCLQVGLGEDQLTRWDLAETSNGGPFSEINHHDILINCVYISSPISPFVTKDSLAESNRRLRIICDVSADATCEYNPLPIYNRTTTLANPTLRVQTCAASSPLELISIDQLPSLLPRESSEAFSAALLPSLMQIKNKFSSTVWQRAAKIFDDKIKYLLETHTTPDVVQFYRYSDDLVRSILLPSLKKDLPYSNPIYNRISAHHNSPDRHCVYAASFAPSSSRPDIYTIVFSDRSRHSEAQVWVFNSLSTLRPVGDLSAPSGLSAIQTRLLDNHMQSMAKFLCRTEVPDAPGWPFQPTIKFGSLHSTLTESFERWGPIIRITKWDLYIIPVPISSPDEKNVKEKLMGFTDGRVPDSQLGIIISTSSIPRRKSTLKMLPNESLTDLNSKLVAWAYLGIEGSLATLYVLPEYRGKGFAYCVAKNLLSKLKSSAFKEMGFDSEWVHADIAKENLASIGVTTKLGGFLGWENAFVWLNSNEL